MKEARAWGFFRQLTDELLAVHRSRVQSGDYQNSKQSDYGLEEIAEVYCAASLAEHAKEIFSQLSDAGERTHALSELEKARVQGTLPQLVHNLEQERWAKDDRVPKRESGETPSLKDTIVQLADSAAECAQSGEREKAAEIFGRIFTDLVPKFDPREPDAFGYKSDPEKCNILCHVAIKQHEAGFDSAETIAKASAAIDDIPKNVSYHAIDSECDREMAQIALCNGLASVCRQEEALKLYAELEPWSGFHKVPVYTLVAQSGNAGSDMVAFAMELLGMADKRIIGAGKDYFRGTMPSNRAELRMSIAAALRENGHIDEARSLYEDAADLLHGLDASQGQTRLVYLHYIGKSYAATLQRLSPDEIIALQADASHMGDKALLETIAFMPMDIGQ